MARSRGSREFDRLFGIAWFEGFAVEIAFAAGLGTFIRYVAISFLTGGCSDAESKPGVACIPERRMICGRGGGKPNVPAGCPRSETAKDGARVFQ
ncbi:MAG: hypothetical protein IJ679_02965 [Lachnospiraceae bacterium]|nr:hypothetical protein [Lachnospiraceae bacterium]